MPTTSRPDFYYLESDGQVYLIKERGLWRFPRKTGVIPCSFDAIHIIPVDGKRVLFAKPHLDRHPHHWFHKDHLVGDPTIDPLVQKAVQRTLPRGAAKVAIIEGGKVLMVKAGRGLTKGYWNLPGGFIGYGEHPDDSAKREVLEELGIRITLKKVLGIYSQVFPRTGGYMISFVYLGVRLSKQLKPHPEEIEEIRWIPVKEALRITLNPFAKAALRDYLSSRHPRGS